MADVVFNPEQEGNDRWNGRLGPKRGAVMAIFMKLFGLQDETKANQVMLAVAVIFFITSAVILFIYL